MFTLLFRPSSTSLLWEINETSQATHSPEKLQIYTYMPCQYCFYCGYYCYYISLYLKIEFAHVLCLHFAVNGHMEKKWLLWKWLLICNGKNCRRRLYCYLSTLIGLLNLFSHTIILAIRIILILIRSVTDTHTWNNKWKPCLSSLLSSDFSFIADRKVNRKNCSFCFVYLLILFLRIIINNNNETKTMDKLKQCKSTGKFVVIGIDTPGKASWDFQWFGADEQLSMAWWPRRK